MSLSNTFNSNHATNHTGLGKVGIPILLMSCTIIAGKIILFDLPVELRIPALTTILTPAVTLVSKISNLSSRNEQILGGLTFLMNGNITVNWMRQDIESAPESKLHVTSILQNLDVHKFFFDHGNNKDKETRISSLAEENKSTSPALSELSGHLADELTQLQLQKLAKEACDCAIDNLKVSDKVHLESLGLAKDETRYQFYSDVYFYLRVWLKNSIEYDMEMPDIGRSIKDVSIYLDAFKFLRAERTEYFLSPGDQFTFSVGEMLKTIQHYLDSLIGELETVNSKSGFFNRLFTGHR